MVGLVDVANADMSRRGYPRWGGSVGRGDKIGEEMLCPLYLLLFIRPASGIRILVKFLW